MPSEAQRKLRAKFMFILLDLLSTSTFPHIMYYVDNTFSDPGVLKTLYLLLLVETLVVRPLNYLYFGENQLEL